MLISVSLKGASGPVSEARASGSALLFADRRSFRCGVDACPVTQADLPELCSPGAVLNDRLKERIDESTNVRVFRQTDTVGIHRPEYITGNGVDAGVLLRWSSGSTCSPSHMCPLCPAQKEVIRGPEYRPQIPAQWHLVHLCQNAWAGGTGLGRNNSGHIQAANAGYFSIAVLDQHSLLRGVIRSGKGDHLLAGRRDGIGGKDRIHLSLVSTDSRVEEVTWVSSNLVSSPRI